MITDKRCKRCKYVLSNTLTIDEHYKMIVTRNKSFVCRFGYSSWYPSEKPSDCLLIKGEK